MSTEKFLLSLAGFFVYIRTKSIWNIYLELDKNLFFEFVCRIKQFVWEMCSGVPP